MSEGNTVARVTPRTMVASYAGDFASVLPAHVKSATFVRVAQGALKKGKRDANGATDLEKAANADPGQFMATLLDAARLGLEPGTEQYHLTVKGGKILGIVGYQGYIELIYRAGAASSVVVECVYANDQFEYSPGVHAKPQHTINWYADRGKLVLVYAYAVMKDGATSKVVVLNESAINKIKATAATQMIWNASPDAMWMKSAVRQLAKWVPTSAEIRTGATAIEPEAIVQLQSVELPDEYDDGEPLEGVVVE